MYLCAGNNAKLNYKIMTKVFEVKVKGKWSKVRATSIMALSNWSKENNVKDWRMVGMMSISETAASQNLIIVA